MIKRENISTKQETAGNRRLPLTHSDKIVYHENAEVFSDDFPMICHSFSTDQSGFIFVPHWHQLFEIIYIEQGFPQFTCNGEIYNAEPGDMLIFNCTDVHACIYAEAPYKSRTLQFDPAILLSKQEHLFEYKYLNKLFQKQIKISTLIKNCIHDQIFDLFCKIENEFKTKNEAYELTIKGLLFLLTSVLFRSYRIKNKKDESIEFSTITNKTNQNRFSFAYEYIQAHYYDDIHIEDLSKQLFITDSYLRKIFKCYSGRSFQEVLNSIRITQAAKLLIETDFSITEIAIKVGFNDVNYFSRIFKKIIGVSPSVLKSQHNSTEI